MEDIYYSVCSVEVTRSNGCCHFFHIHSLCLNRPLFFHTHIAIIQTYETCISLSYFLLTGNVFVVVIVVLLSTDLCNAYSLHYRRSNNTSCIHIACIYAFRTECECVFVFILYFTYSAFHHSVNMIIHWTHLNWTR